MKSELWIAVRGKGEYSEQSQRFLDESREAERMIKAIGLKVKIKRIEIQPIDTMDNFKAGLPRLQIEATGIEEIEDVFGRVVDKLLGATVL